MMIHLAILGPGLQAYRGCLRFHIIQFPFQHSGVVQQFGVCSVRGSNIGCPGLLGMIAYRNVQDATL